MIDIERLLFDLGAVKESDVRLKRDKEEEEEAQKEDHIEDYDDDWD